jgi:hypothetical protein
VVLLTGHEDPTSGPWEGLPAMEVVGLADDDARRLVGAVVPDADEALVDHAVRAAGGNPLALHELPTLDPEIDGETPLLPSGGPVPVGPRLQRAFCARVEALKPSARALLLLAAAEDRGDRHVLHRAGSGWGVDTSSWDEALRSGLIRASGARLEFRHPLVRAAVYDGAPFLERQAVHRALAAALPTSAVEERAWHLAAAADGPDEDVAALLEQADGGPHAAAGGRALACAGRGGAPAGRGRPCRVGRRPGRGRAATDRGRRAPVR